MHLSNGPNVPIPSPLRFELAPLKNEQHVFLFKMSEHVVWIERRLQSFSTEQVLNFTHGHEQFSIRGPFCWPIEISIESSTKVIANTVDVPDSTVWRHWLVGGQTLQNLRSKRDYFRFYHRYDLLSPRSMVATWFRVGRTGRVAGITRLGAGTEQLAAFIGIVVSSIFRWDASMT